MEKELKLIDKIKDILIMILTIVVIILGVKTMVGLYNKYEIMKPLLTFIISFNITKFIIKYTYFYFASKNIQKLQEENQNVKKL